MNQTLLPDLAPGVRPWKRTGYKRDATISPCGRYREDLVRQWADKPALAVVGINPSDADANRDDPTIWRCCDFADLAGFGSLVMLNAFTLRSPNVGDLAKAADPVGPNADRALLEWAHTADRIVIAWGPPSKVPAALRPRFAAVLDLLIRRDLYVLRLTAGGHPEHPVRLPRACRPVLWRGRA